MGKLQPAALTRVLIVEDSADLCESLAALVRAAGHAVVEARDAESALARARLFRPDLVLADTGLPGLMDGYGLARAVRRDPQLRSCYLVALTGYAFAADVTRAREAGFDEHMAKPVDPAAIRYLAAQATSARLMLPSSQRRGALRRDRGFSARFEE